MIRLFEGRKDVGRRKTGLALMSDARCEMCGVVWCGGEEVVKTAKTVEMAHRVESLSEKVTVHCHGTHGWLIKVCFLGWVPTFAGRVPLDRADVAEVGFAVGQPGGGQAVPRYLSEGR